MLTYSQRDPAWSQQKLGTGKLTIGNVGCLLTCAAGVLTSYCHPINPEQLNQYLINNHGFVDDNLFVFQSLEPLGAKLGDLIFCPYVDAPLAKIRNALSLGCEIIVEVDSTPGGTIQQHWVRLLDEFTISDPWQLPGKTIVPIKHYGLATWTAVRIIIAVAIYKPISAVSIPAATVMAELDRASGKQDVQAALCPRVKT